MVSAPRRYPAIEEKTTLRDNPILVISLKSVTTEAVDTEDFVLPKPYVFSSVLSDCKDSLKIDSKQRKTILFRTIESLARGTQVKSLKRVN